MADHEFDIVQWSDVNGDRYTGMPPGEAFGPNMTDEHIDGVMVKSWDASDPDSVEYHWVYQARDWVTWEDMLDDVNDALDMYGAAAT